MLSELLFRIDHLFRHAAIHSDTLTVDKVVMLITEEEAGASNIIGFPHPTRQVKGVVFGAQKLLFIDANPTGRDAIYSDMQWCERHCQSVCHRPDSAFGSSVSLRTRLALQIARGAEIDDSSVPILRILILPVDGQQTRGNKRAAEIGIQHLLKMLDCGFCNGFEAADADIIHNHIEVAPLIKKRLHTVFQCRLVANIEEEEARAGRAGKFFTSATINITECHTGTLLAERLDDSATDSVCCARYKNSFHISTF